mmetsp:Transcript_52795/g.150497  ORF Transcript_52795/g.150497 Transcript_52795/m.150497 type:complete len:552 (+) Transcript_52795:1593-3248(+)
MVGAPGVADAARRLVRSVHGEWLWGGTSQPARQRRAFGRRQSEGSCGADTGATVARHILDVMNKFAVWCPATAARATKMGVVVVYRSGPKAEAAPRIGCRLDDEGYMQHAAKLARHTRALLSTQCHRAVRALVRAVVAADVLRAPGAGGRAFHANAGTVRGATLEAPSEAGEVGRAWGQLARARKAQAQACLQCSGRPASGGPATTLEELENSARAASEAQHLTAVPDLRKARLAALASLLPLVKAAQAADRGPMQAAACVARRPSDPRMRTQEVPNELKQVQAPPCWGVGIRGCVVRGARPCMSSALKPIEIDFSPVKAVNVLLKEGTGAARRVPLAAIAAIQLGPICSRSFSSGPSCTTGIWPGMVRRTMERKHRDGPCCIVCFREDDSTHHHKRRKQAGKLGSKTGTGFCTAGKAHTPDLVFIDTEPVGDGTDDGCCVRHLIGPVRLSSRRAVQLLRGAEGMPCTLQQDEGQRPVLGEGSHPGHCKELVRRLTFSRQQDLEWCLPGSARLVVGAEVIGSCSGLPGLDALVLQVARTPVVRVCKGRAVG